MTEIIKSKYTIGEMVLLSNGKIERIDSIHFERRWGSDYSFKYHFERFWQSFRWEDEIIKSIECTTHIGKGGDLSLHSTYMILNN